MSSKRSKAEDVTTQEFEPWYQHLYNKCPFELEVEVTQKLDPTRPKSYRSIAIFPWKLSSLDILWPEKQIKKQEKAEQWQGLIQKWAGVVVVGGTSSHVRFFLCRRKQQYLPLFSIKVPGESPDIGSVVWCLDLDPTSDTFIPLVAFSNDRVIYVFDVENGRFHGTLCGHGGVMSRINALSVHPAVPNILASASRDHSVRIYNLSLAVAMREGSKQSGPSWPNLSGSSSSKMKPVLGGPAFGLRAPKQEGEGKGRCFAVLAGGASGGHLGSVTGLAFHPYMMIIATCGVDHAVKIWRIPIPTDPSYTGILREDKPMFSSSRIHRSQVVSVSWVSKDILISSSGPVIMRAEEFDESIKEEHPYRYWKEPATAVLWQWLGMDRFFPPNFEVIPQRIRGCASDYLESTSLKILSRYALPIPLNYVSRMHVFSSPSHTALLAFHSVGCIFLSSLRHFKPLKPPPFPLYTREATSDSMEMSTEIDASAEEIVMGGQEGGCSMNGMSEISTTIAESSTEATINSSFRNTNETSLDPKDPELPHWIVEISFDSSREEAGASGDDSDEDTDIENESSILENIKKVNLFSDVATESRTKTPQPRIEACAISENGRLMIGVGEKEGIWIWQIPQQIVLQSRTV